MSNFDINVDRRTDEQTDERKSRRLCHKVRRSGRCFMQGLTVVSGLPFSGRTTYITPWDCHRTSKLNFKDVPRTSFVRPKSIPETSKNCQKAHPLLTSCMMFAPPTYRKFATCVDWALRTSNFPLAGVLLTAVSSVAAPFWWLRDHCVYLSRVLSWLIDVFIIKFSTATLKIFVEIIWSHYYFLIFTS